MGTQQAIGEVIRPTAHTKTAMRVRMLAQDEIDSIAVICWRNLAMRSCHQNPFLLPEFVLPAWKYLTPERSHVLVIVESVQDGRWMAAGGFTLGQITFSLPVPHAVAATSDHTFRTGLLLDADHAPQALDLLLSKLTTGDWRCQGVEFPELRADSILARELAESVKRLGYSWHSLGHRMAPALFPGIISDERLASHWSAARRKTFRRSRHKLEAVGPVELRLHRSPDAVAPALENFLRLEAASWKGDNGTACLSNRPDELFIREVVDGLARHGNVLISELTAGDRVAAAAVNFNTGTGLFAFKIGWDRELAHTSPGVLHEVELLHASRNRLSEFTLFDSCATESSYIAPIWPDRIPIVTGLVCSSHVARLTRCLLDSGANAKRLVASWW